MTPAEAGTGVLDAPVPAAPAGPAAGAPPMDPPPGRADPVPGPTGRADPVPVTGPAAGVVVLDRSEVQDLCDVLWRAERALCARGWQRLGRATGSWVAVLEARLWVPEPP